MNWLLEVVMNVEKKPYTDDYIDETTWIRTFDPTVIDSEEYVWHRDKKDRTIISLGGIGWQFQFDNEIPKRINIGETIYIQKEVYHRIISGETPLRLLIKEVE